jgi:hypothetical protein
MSVITVGGRSTSREASCLPALEVLPMVQLGEPEGTRTGGEISSGAAQRRRLSSLPEVLATTVNIGSHRFFRFKSAQQS